MNKAETVDHYIVNLKIHNEEFARHAKDEYVINSVNNVVNDLVSKRKISAIKRLLKEFEVMLLESDIATYRHVMGRIFKEGYVYKTYSEELELTIGKVIDVGKIKSKKEYANVLYYVDVNYDDEKQAKTIKMLNNMLVEFETKHTRDNLSN